MNSERQQQLMREYLNPPKHIISRPFDDDPVTFQITRKPTTWLEKKLITAGLLKPVIKLPMPNLSLRTATTLQKVFRRLDKDLTQGDIPHLLVEINRDDISRIVAIALANRGGRYSRSVYNNVRTHFDTKTLRLAFILVLKKASLDELMEAFAFLKHLQDLELQAQLQQNVL